MLPIIIGISLIMFSLIVIVMTLFFWDARKFDWIILIISTIALIFGAALVIVCFTTPTENYEVDTCTNLYALDSGSGVHGVFVLGGGSVNDVQYYIGYTNIGDNKFTQIKFDASKSILVLDDNETPRAETYKYHRKYFGIWDEEFPEYTTYIYIPTTGLRNTYGVN